MSELSSIKLKCSSIKNVPISTYCNDFMFIVNGKEFKTSHLISDLLSPIISNIHSTDPTFERFAFNTKNSGDFSRILQLVNFDDIHFSGSEFPFIFEVIKILGNDNKCIEIKTKSGKTFETQEITNKNVFN